MRVAGRTDLWSPIGPTDDGVALRDLDDGVLSSGERVMLLVTFTLWDGDETIQFKELARLSPDNLFAVGSLVASCAADAMQAGHVKPYVDEWIAEERKLFS